MAFRAEEIKTIITKVICDNCKKERVLYKGNHELGFDNRMNACLGAGYAFKVENGVFKNYCETCKGMV